MNDAISQLKPFFKEDLRRRGVEIKTAQRNVVARCPVHEEKTGSFAIYEEHGHCFGCGWHGDIVDLEAYFSGRCSQRDFVAIVKDLSERYGVSQGLESGTRLGHHRKSVGTQESAKVEANKAASELKLKVLSEYDNSTWRAVFLEQSPQVLDNPSQEWRWLLQSLFQSEDRIWLGGRFDSHARNFQLLRNVAKLDLPDELIPRSSDCFALGRFREDAQGRRSECLLGCDFILIECDELIDKKAENCEEREQNKRLNAAVIRWLNTYEDMTLRAIYDTGGKSLHSIWDKPPEKTLELLKGYCEPLGIDSQPLTSATAPLRLPESLHEKTGEPASLLYLNPKF